jgi:hypothetical protein
MGDTLFDEKLTHHKLCEKTAQRFLKDFDVILFDYQVMGGDEFPDVLCYNASPFNGTTELFEIKIDYQDFKNDCKKQCRKTVEIKYFPEYRFTRHDIHKEIKNIKWSKYGIEEFFKQKPHLGRRRYYVCPKGLIQSEEIENGFGLYWYDGRFHKKKESKNFKNNVFDEKQILTHAFRKYANGNKEGILIKMF